MNSCSKSKICRVLALSLIPLLCMGGLVSMALLSERTRNNANAGFPRSRHYDLARFLSDAHQVVAVLDYLTQIDTPIPPQRLAQNCRPLPQPQPLLTESNYTLVLVTNKVHPI